MSHRKTFAIRIAGTVRRWLPGAQSIAGAAAATGDPAALLDLESDPGHDHDAAGAR